MKNKLLIIISIVVIATMMILFIRTGFIKRTDVYLVDYSLSKDGLSIIMDVGIASSIGYTREYTIEQGGDNKYITFYSAFGGLNSKVGAKNKFQIELNPSCTQIYFYRGDAGYTLVLQKDKVTNEWIKAE